MEFRFLPFLAMATILAFAVSHAALPAEMYWRSVFPKTIMPEALRNLLIPAVGTNKMLADMVKHDDAASKAFYEFKGTKKMLADMVKHDDATDAKIFYEFKGNKNMLSDMVKNKDNIIEGNAPTDKDVFFFESELHPGRKMNLNDLTKKASKATFLPHSVAESIPFSTQKFPEILKYFSLEAKSAEANLLKQTIEDCERPAIDGEEKYCATSLVSFIDSGVSKLGKNIQLLSTELEKETQNQEFTIDQGVKMMEESEIVCHKLQYAYAVFLCHSIDKTALYTVPLVGADGTRARALAVCHKDTSAWNPKHLAFQILKVKPGTVPICHFLARETLVWVRN